MEDPRLFAENDETGSDEPGLPGEAGDQIIVGNLSGTVAAIGRGASVIYNQALSAADQARASEDFEYEKLAKAVGRLVKSLYDQLRKPPPATDSPYKYLLPFEFSDVWRFFGREDFREETLAAICCPDRRGRLAVLHGDAGMGKTSLLRAAVAPALVADGHLPLSVRVSHEPIATSVKRALLPNLAQLAYLQAIPLSEFLRLVQELLPEGKHVYLLVDQFEEFFDQPIADRERFVNELADCLYGGTEAGRWLLSVQSAKVGYLSTLTPQISQPLANTLVLSPLTAEQARAAILKPAALAALEVEERLVDSLLQDLGGDAIDPSRLQLVCHTLTQSGKPGQKALSFAAYTEAGRVEGILRNHLTMVLERNLPPNDREPAWRALAAIAEKPAGARYEKVISDLKGYRVEQDQALRVLEILEINRIIRLRDQVYHLTSPSLVEPIHKWAAQRAALEQAQIEARRQLERVRDSALRGVVGGAIGFMLAFLITYLPQANDRVVGLIFSLFEGVNGAVAGIIFIFGLDIARASFHGRNRWLQILWTALAGAIAFGAAFLFHKVLFFSKEEDLILAALEGGLWGLVAGAGTGAILASTRRYRQTVPVFTVLSGLALWLSDKIGRVYKRPGLGSNVELEYLGLLIGVAGALMFICVAVAAVWGKSHEASGLESKTQENTATGGLQNGLA